MSDCDHKHEIQGVIDGRHVLRCTKCGNVRDQDPFPQFGEIVRGPEDAA